MGSTDPKTLRLPILGKGEAQNAKLKTLLGTNQTQFIGTNFNSKFEVRRLVSNYSSSISHRGEAQNVKLEAQITHNSSTPFLGKKFKMGDWSQNFAVPYLGKV